MTVQHNSESWVGADWSPQGRPTGLVGRALRLQRADGEPSGSSLSKVTVPADGEVPGPQVSVGENGETVVRFWHHAPQTQAVALQANGWWQSGMRDVQSEPRLDPRTPNTHRAARGGGLRAVVDVVGPVAAKVAMPVHDLPVDMTIPHATRARWCAPGLAASGDGASSGSDTGKTAPVPLLIVTDAEGHVDRLDTPALLAGAVRDGLLPPLIAVFLDAGPQRGEEPRELTRYPHRSGDPPENWWASRSTQVDDTRR